MKKFYAVIFTLGTIISLNGQATINFQVDMTDYIANGGTLATIKIAGAFNTLTGGAVPDWAPPSSPVFEDLGNNVWGTTITFTEAGNLIFKFLNTADSWGDCNIVQECMAEDAGACVVSDGGGNVNRSFDVGVEDLTVCYKWESCDACGGVGTSDLNNASNIKVFPNPMSGNVATVTFNNANGEAHKITLSNIAGQVMREFNNVRTNSVEIERGNLNAGMYFISVSNELGEISSKKLVIK
jgi:hypothetical protein